MFEFDRAPARTVGVHFTAHTGAAVVTPRTVAAAAVALHADFTFTLADETTANLSKRRAENAAKRTARWTAEFLEELRGPSAARPACPAADAASAAADGGPTAKRLRYGAGEPLLPDAAIVGSIPGHAIPHRGRAVAADIAKFDAELSGYYIAGNGLGETEAEWRDIVATAKRDLPPGRPLFVCGAPTPHAVLEQVRLGFDVIESRCAMDATDAGLALSFSFPGSPHFTTNGSKAPASVGAGGGRRAGSAESAAAAAGDAETGGTVAAAATPAPPEGCVDLNDAAHKLDSGPLLPGCACMACRDHSRAYVHHLLDTKEILGWALLEAHNVHHMQAFVTAARAAVARGGLAAFTAAVQPATPALAKPCAPNSETGLR